MTRNTKRPRVKTNTPSPKQVKVARQLKMDPPFKEVNAQSADLEDNSKLLKELSVKLEHIIKKLRI